MTRLTNALLLAMTLLLTSTHYTQSQSLGTIATLLGGESGNQNNPAGAAPSSSSGCGSNEPCTGNTPLTPAQIYALCEQNSQNNAYAVDQCPSAYTDNSAPIPTQYTGGTYTSPNSGTTTTTSSSTTSTTTTAASSTASPLNSLTGQVTSVITSIANSLTNSTTSTTTPLGLSSQQQGTSDSGTIFTRNNILSVTAGIVAVGAYLM